MPKNRGAKPYAETKQQRQPNPKAAAARKADDVFWSRYGITWIETVLMSSGMMYSDLHQHETHNEFNPKFIEALVFEDKYLSQFVNKLMSGK